MGFRIPGMFAFPPPLTAGVITQFHEDQKKLVTERVNVILLLGWALVPLFGIADYFLFPQSVGRFLAYRLAAAVCCFVLYVVNRRWKSDSSSIYLGLAGAYVVSLAIIAMIVETGGFSTPYYAGLNLVFLGMCVVLPVRVELLAINCAIIYAIYLFSVLLLGQGGQFVAFPANNMFILSTVVIALLANHVGYRARLREYLIRKELESAQAQLERYSRDLENLFNESESMYQILVDNANESIFVLQDDVMKFPNPRTIELFGYSKEELTRMPFMEFILDEDKNAVWGQKRQAEGKTRVTASSMYRIVRPSKETIWVDMNAISIEWIERPAFLVSLRDVTEKKMMEAELVHAQKMEAIGTLAGGVAHDFNNLLTGIVGYTSLMLLHKDATDPDYDHLRSIEQLVHSGANLTGQLLGFARGGKYEVKPTDLNELMRRSSEMFGRTKREINIHRKYQKDIHTVDVDRGQIEQVLLNLFLNASQAMPAEGGELYLETQNVTLDAIYANCHSVEPGEYVRMSVTDTGTGMDQATQQRIFEPFFTTKEMGRGTGLGLASVYGIVKSHNGIINVYSEVGRGTTFNIYFPTSLKLPVEEEITATEVVRSTGAVLLVDDQDFILNVGRDMLEALGYEVFLAEGGREAVELYTEKKDSIDLVILDMIMPTMSGGETYDRLKALNPAVRVVLSSGYSVNDQTTKIMDRGCNGFIQKPFNIKDLSLKIREVLDGREYLGHP